MVFQSPLLFPHMSIGDNVALRPAHARGRPRRATAPARSEALERVQLPGVADRRAGAAVRRPGAAGVARPRAGRCSRRCCCSTSRSARSTPSLRVEVRELVAQLQREAGVTTLFVTHDQEEATVLADRVALMLDGRLRPGRRRRASFYERPASLAVARFFGTANAFPAPSWTACWRGALGDVRVGAPDGPGRARRAPGGGPRRRARCGRRRRASSSGTVLHRHGGARVGRRRRHRGRARRRPDGAAGRRATGCACTCRPSTARSCRPRRASASGRARRTGRATPRRGPPRAPRA